jgi:tetratricopeptide (TPR) repeat protein
MAAAAAILAADQLGQDDESELEGDIEAPLAPMPDDELPDWLQELRGESEIGETFAPTDQQAEPALAQEDELEPTPEEDLPDWLQQLRPAEELQSAETALLAVEAEPELETEPLEPLAGSTDEAMPALPDEMEDMEWLRELEQATVEEVAETPIITPEPVEPTPIVQAAVAKEILEEQAVAPVEPPPPVTPEAPPEPAAVEPAPVEEAPVPVAQDTETRLAWARTRLSEGALDESAQEYEQLVQEPDLANELVGELEDAVQSNPKHHALQRVLGDAYMRTGKLQQALEAYRQALSKL